MLQQDPLRKPGSNRSYNNTVNSYVIQTLQINYPTKENVISDKNNHAIQKSSI